MATNQAEVIPFPARLPRIKGVAFDSIDGILVVRVGAKSSHELPSIEAYANNAGYSRAMMTFIDPKGRRDTRMYERGTHGSWRQESQRPVDAHDSLNTPYIPE